MNVVMPTDADAARWGPDVTHMAMMSPTGQEDEVEPCSAVLTQDDRGVVSFHVLWQPDADDVERLNRGAGVWLVCMNGLPPHRLEVGEPAG